MRSLDSSEQALKIWEPKDKLKFFNLIVKVWLNQN